MRTSKKYILLAALCICMQGAWAQSPRRITTTALTNAINSANEVLNTSDDYLPDAVARLTELVAYADELIAHSEQLTQAQINTARQQLVAFTTQVKSTKGLTLPEVAHTRADYNPERGFIHPGLLHTEADIERVRGQLSANNPAVVAGFNQLKSNSYSSSSFTPYPVETIIRGGGTGENYINAARSAHAAYMNALMWRLQGTKANANCAVKILNAWAATCKGIGGDSNYALAAGLYGYEFANAAELMRDYEGWEAEDFRAFQQWMLDVWYPSVIGFMRGRNGTWENSGHWWQAPGHYWSNWGLCCDLALMSIGILCDDVFIYNQGLSFYKYDQCNSWKDIDPTTLGTDDYVWSWGLTEYLGNLVPVESDCPDGMTSPFGKLSQMQESGRDQGHATMALGLAVDICQTAFNQGDDLWAYMDDRLAGGIEHLAAYNFSGIDNVPFVKYVRQSNGYTAADGRGGVMTGMSDASRGQVRPYWARIIGYYEGLRGVSMPYSEKALQAMGADGGGSGGTSGGYDHLGYSALMCTRDAVDSGHGIAVLKTSITQGAKVIAHNELGGLTNTFTVNTKTCVSKGTELTLSASLPEGADEAAGWLWSTGATTPSISITADESQLYRVTCTGSNGVESTAVFSIAVENDAIPTILTPSVTYNGTTLADSTVEVLYGETVSLSVDPACGWGTYRWSTGEDTQSITTSPVTTSHTVTAYYINQGATVSAQTFHIKVVNAIPYIQTGETKNQTTELMVEVGEDVTLGLELPLTVEGESVAWSDGSKGATLTLSEIQESQEATATFTHAAGQVETAFTVLVKDTEKRTDVGPGPYMILHVASGKYLTFNEQGELTTFEEGDPEHPAESQVWTIEQKDLTGRYNIVSLHEGLTLNNAGKASTLAIYQFYFQQAKGMNRYAIYTGASSPKYWDLAADGVSANPSASTSLTGYPFMLVPVDYNSTGISTPTDTHTSGSAIYDLSGRQLKAIPSKGIYVSEGKAYLRR